MLRQAKVSQLSGEFTLDVNRRLGLEGEGSGTNNSAVELLQGVDKVEGYAGVTQIPIIIGPYICGGPGNTAPKFTENISLHAITFLLCGKRDCKRGWY